MKKVKYKDLEFNTITEAGKYFGVNSSTITRRVNRTGESYEKAIDMILAGKEKCWKDHEGNRFKTLREMCDYHGVNFYTASSRLYNQGFSIEKVLTKKSGFSLTYDGKTYPSVSALLREKNKSVRQWYRFRMKNKTLSKEKALKIFLTEK